MYKNSKTQTIIAELCQKLRCSELAEDLKRVNHAQQMLVQLQQNKVLKSLKLNKDDLKVNSNYTNTSQKLSNLLLKTKQRLNTVKPSSSSNGSSDKVSVHKTEEQLRLEEEYEMEPSIDCDDLPEDAWLGFFRGYEILEENHDNVICENKQCIELSLKDDNYSLANYLRAGIRCFMIDLFTGTALENQKLIFTLRESELKVSQEYGFPIISTLFALLSPRLQYTGVMDARYSTEELKKDDELILTTKRKYSTIGNCYKIYVNGRFLIEDCKEGDFILVGPTIQLKVAELLDEELRCLVMEPGLLSSRLPVRFPARCSRSQISLEELEDITFAREVGINVLVSYKPGSLQYLNDLYDALRLLKSDHLRLFTRLALNEYNDETTDLDWIAQRYDGFLVDLSTQQDASCQDQQDILAITPDILRLSSTAVNFMTRVYYMKKPIVLKPSLLAERQLLVQPANISHIFYYPDKYIFSSGNYSRAFSFYLLQNALSEQITTMELSMQPFCDHSNLGDDTIARACVAASFDCQAKAIVVCSAQPDMSIKLSHFRPRAPILHVSATKSLGDYISLYHHIVFMHFQTHVQYNYADYITNAFMFAVIFLKSRNILNVGENLILVYGSNHDTKFCDKYLVFKFDGKHFALNLEELLFK